MMCFCAFILSPFVEMCYVEMFHRLSLECSICIDEASMIRLLPFPYLNLIVSGDCKSFLNSCFLKNCEDAARNIFICFLVLPVEEFVLSAVSLCGVDLHALFIQVFPPKFLGFLGNLHVYYVISDTTATSQFLFLFLSLSLHHVFLLV